MAIKYDYYNGGILEASATIYVDKWIAQTFTTSATYKVFSVKLCLAKNGTPEGTFTVSIKGTTAGKPSGVDLCSYSVTVSSIGLTTSAVWYEFYFTTQITLTIGQIYAIVVRDSSGSTSNCPKIYATNSGTYSGGGYVASTDGGGTWGTVSTTTDNGFEVWGTGGYPSYTYYSKKLVALANNSLYYESALGVMTQLAASAVGGELYTDDSLSVFELGEKIFIINSIRRKVCDFGNVKITTTSLGGDYPDKGDILTGGTSGAKMVVDYITALSGACTIYGKRMTTATFVAETVTGIIGGGHSGGNVSFTGTAEVAGPHWYNWTAYGDAALATNPAYGKLPSKAILGCNYRGRAILSGNIDYPHQWYMARQGNPWDWVYVAGDAQAPVAGGDSDAGEIGDIITTLIPYKDDFLMFGCVGSMWFLTGDPMEGGSLNELDLTTGIFGPQSWCFDNAGNFYFWGRNGIYKTTIPGIPVCISQIRLPNLVNDENVNPTTHRIIFSFDSIRSGIIISITVLTTGVNSNYFYSLITQGFFPETYPEECSVFSSFYYEATGPTYRKLILGCNDGYLRIFDDADKSDDIGGTDEAIDSYVGFGPLMLSQSPDMTGILNNVDCILVGGTSGLSQSDSNDIYYKVYVSNNAENVLEKLVAAGNPNIGGTISPSAVRRGQGIKKKVKGVYAGIKIGNNTTAETWGMEQLILGASPAGRLK